MSKIDIYPIRHPPVSRLRGLKALAATIMSFDLQRFVDAQAPVYEAALAELRAGRKQTHWMWFIFPQHRSVALFARSG